MPGQKGLDEFVYVLMVGLIIIIVALFAWGLPPEQPEGNISTDLSGSFVIGVFPQDVPRHIRIGRFTVSYALGSDVLNEKKDIEVKKGITVNEPYSMSASIDQDLSLVTGGFVIIDVLDTNSQGKLVVKVNDNVVWNKKTQAGRLDVSVDKEMLKEYNVVEISTSGPGWKFWTSSVYRIDMTQFGINFFGNLQKSETFEVYEDELRRFKSAMVEFELEDYDGTGDLVIEINGRRIFEDEPSRIFSQSFEDIDVGLAKGINTITFSTEKETSYDIDDAEIIIIHEETGQKTRSFSFDVETKKSGEVNFYVESSNCLGSLLITITDAEGNERLLESMDECQTRERKKLLFSMDYVSVGTNFVTFKSSGDRSATLSDVEVKV